jgi:hypothetical protein
VVLLLNDHVLKGSGMLPGALTGKLSDFAGLLVAPVLLTAVLPGGQRSRRAIAFAVVVAGFVGLKVSSELARFVERVSAIAGLPWRVWVDPTDLLALGVLPVAWKLSAHAEWQCRARTAGVGTRDRLAVVLGSAACLATSTGYSLIATRIYLLNTARHSADVRIFRSAQPLSCNDDPEVAVSSATFLFESCRRAEPFHSVPLDHDHHRIGGPMLESSGPARPCDAVVLRIAGLPDTVIYWRDGDDKREAEEWVELGSNPDRNVSAVFLETVGRRWVLTPSADSEAWTYQGSLPEGSCPAGR